MNNNMFHIIFAGILLSIGFAIMFAGIYGFFWIAIEIYHVFTVETSSNFLGKILTYINSQSYTFSAKSSEGDEAIFSISPAIMQWLYAFLAVLLLKAIPSIFKIVINTGSEIIITTIKQLNCKHTINTNKSDGSTIEKNKDSLVG